MKIAIISDIHSNYNALVKVVDEINKFDCDIKICLGDAVGYYNKPNETIETLKRNKFKCVKGNHDRFILDETEYNKKHENIYGIKRHRQILNLANLMFLKSCPDFIELQYKNYNCCFCHSLKSDCQVYLKDDIDIIEHFEHIKKYDYYFYGHTHRKKTIAIEKTVIINPGSVGQQRDYDWKPSFCILDLNKNQYKIFSVSYDIKSYVNELNKYRYDQRLINILQKY